MNPYLAVNSFEETGINAMDMIYGTCADVEITINEKKYYIPTIVVDVKSYSYPLGTFQTGREFQTGNLDLNYDDGSLKQKGNIVEFYVDQDAKGLISGHNRSKGLKGYSDGSLLIYPAEMME